MPENGLLSKVKHGEIKRQLCDLIFDCIKDTSMLEN